MNFVKFHQIGKAWKISWTELITIPFPWLTLYNYHMDGSFFCSLLGENMKQAPHTQSFKWCAWSLLIRWWKPDHNNNMQMRHTDKISPIIFCINTHGYWIDLWIICTLFISMSMPEYFRQMINKHTMHGAHQSGIILFSADLPIGQT